MNDRTPPSQQTEQTAAAPLTVPCPHCGKPARWAADNPSRPFCCERCKLIDLGAWASESHRIPGDDAPQEDENG